MRQTNVSLTQDVAQFNSVRRQESVTNPSKDCTNGVTAAEDTNPVFCYAKSKECKQHGTSAMDNFDEYLKKRREQAKEASVDEKTLEDEQKEQAKKIAKLLSTEEISALARMGIDVTGAKLSDIQGIVETMRQNAHKEALTTLLTKMQLSTGNTENLVVSGGKVTVAGTDVAVQGVSVSDLVSEEYSFTAAEDDMVYLLRNDLPLTKENLFKAHFSGSRVLGNPISDVAFENMKSQICEIIRQAGYDISVQSLSGADFLLTNDLPVTTDTISLYMDYQDIIGKNVSEISLPDNQTELLNERAEKLYDDVQVITPELVFRMAKEHGTVTIASAVRYMKEQSEVIKGQPDTEAVIRQRQMAELRLTMTLDAARRLVGKDIHIDTRELSKVVEDLREIEKDRMQYAMREEGMEISDAGIQMIFETQKTVQDLAEVPAAVLASPLNHLPFTLRGLRQEANRFLSERDVVLKDAVSSKQTFETIVRSYEAVGTAPRADMGDSIRKAFSNIEDILQELAMPVNEETTRAVRILGYNSMEITEYNINAVVRYDKEVSELIHNFYPEAVLSFIKEGQNPMDVPIDKLNEKLRERNYHGGVTDAVNYATYLRDMEREGIVTEAERESYIGLYRMMHQLAKSGDREVGYLFATGANLTIRNLLSAMRSRKAQGMDIPIQDDFGMIEERIVGEKRMDAQIEAAFLEDIREDILMRTSKATPLVEQYMTEHHIETSLVNCSAVYEMLHATGGIYDMVQTIMAKLSGYKYAKEQAVDEETENMTASIEGEEIPLPIMPEHVLNQLTDGSHMAAYYDSLSENLTSLLYQTGVYGSVSNADISMVKTVQAGFRILSGQARNNRFSLPISTEKGIRVVNLSVVQGKQAGVTIETRNENGALIQGAFYIQEGKLTGSLVADSHEANMWLMEQAADFMHALDEEGYADADVSLGQLRETTEAKDTVSTKVLYHVSVSCVKAMGVLFS